MEHSIFKPEKVSRTETFVAEAPIETVFPLFGAFEERKWAIGWNPVLIYPENEMIEEGTTFKTTGKGDEPDYLWRVILYDTEAYVIRYLVSTENRYWTINVTCSEKDRGAKTAVTVTYTYIGLNAKGNQCNTRDIGTMFRENLQDWADAINDFIRKH
jgi:hypothetical protein